MLIDSEPIWEQVRRAYVSAQGGHWLPDAQQRLMGMSTAEWAGYLSVDLGVGRPPEEVAAAVVDEMRARYREQLPLMRGALEAVQRMGKHWRLGLASSSPRQLIEAVLDTAGIAGRFAVTVSTDEVPRGKPAPDVYLAASRHLGAHEQCAAVEDSTNGILAAVAAGLAVIAVPRPRYPPASSALDQADAVLDSLTDLTAETIAALRNDKSASAPPPPHPPSAPFG